MTRVLSDVTKPSCDSLSGPITPRRADDVLQTLSELFVEHGPPANLRSDNGPEFTAKVVREWLERVEVKTLYIEPGSPWENGYNESFNGTLGEEVPPTRGSLPNGYADMAGQGSIPAHAGKPYSK